MYVRKNKKSVYPKLRIGSMYYERVDIVWCVEGGAGEHKRRHAAQAGLMNKYYTKKIYIYIFFFISDKYLCKI